MYFLGICSNFHDPAVALVRDNKIVAFVEEERFNRIKHSEGFFPHRALEWVLKKEGIKINDIDRIGYYANPTMSNMIFQKIPQLIKSPIKIVGALRWKERLKRLPLEGLKHYFKYNGSIEYVEHHLCHSASAFFLSGMKKSNILTIDGNGEAASITMRYGNGSEMELLYEVKVPHSLG